MTVTSWVSAHREGMKVGFDNGQGYEQFRGYPMVVFWLHGVVRRYDFGVIVILSREE